ncbi:hypothetical protein K1719_004727 [Acacia pycnantha]|nr:hypothetical protein K1719_004727 [Acacia pycnantha]
MVEDQLYRKGLHSPMLRCLNPNEAGYVLAEIHGGANGQHMGAKALARKPFEQSYTADVGGRFKDPYHFASVEHPQSNGQAEAANKVILDGLKKRMMSWRRKSILSQGEIANNEALAVELDLADEARVTSHCRDIAMKQLIAARYNKKVRPRRFQPGCLVLRRADIGNKNSKDGKLAANWDGPYRVRETLERELTFGKFGWNPYQANMECGQIKGIFQLRLISLFFLKHRFPLCSLFNVGLLAFPFATIVVPNMNETLVRGYLLNSKHCLFQDSIVISFSAEENTSDSYRSLYTLIYSGYQ